jgi:hypothetical protein
VTDVDDVGNKSIRIGGYAVSKQKFMRNFDRNALV